jgi:hypothetical protein
MYTAGMDWAIKLYEVIIITPLMLIMISVGGVIGLQIIRVFVFRDRKKEKWRKWYDSRMNFYTFGLYNRLKK